jgi:arabinose-5-phosphate isomerase
MIRLLPLFKLFSLPTIAITGNVASTLGLAADVALDTSVPEEACPMGLAPTLVEDEVSVLGNAYACGQTPLCQTHFQTVIFG